MRQQRALNMVCRLLVVGIVCVQSVAAEPVWTSVATNGQWKQYSYLAGNSSETFFTSIPSIPNSYLSFPISSQGAYSITYGSSPGFPVTHSTECTYPVGVNEGTTTLTPWWYISSSSMYCPSSPHHNSSNGNVSGPADITACTIMRTASNGYRSEQFTGVKGIQLFGNFNGMVSGGQFLIETVFFNQQNCWAGGPEYGFYVDLVNSPNNLMFYWSTNTNCGAYPNSYCRNGQYPSGSSVYEDYCSDAAHCPGNISPYRSVSIARPAQGSYYIYAYPFQDSADGRYKFWVEVMGADYVVHFATIVDPNTDGSGHIISPDWYPASSLVGATGYVTVGLTRGDTTNSQKYTIEPNITVSDLKVGK